MDVGVNHIYLAPFWVVLYEQRMGFRAYPHIVPHEILIISHEIKPYL